MAASLSHRSSIPALKFGVLFSQHLHLPRERHHLRAQLPGREQVPYLVQRAHLRTLPAGDGRHRFLAPERSPPRRLGGGVVVHRPKDASQFLVDHGHPSASDPGQAGGLGARQVLVEHCAVPPRRLALVPGVPLDQGRQGLEMATANGAPGIGGSAPSTSAAAPDEGGCPPRHSPPNRSPATPRVPADPARADQCSDLTHSDSHVLPPQTADRWAHPDPRRRPTHLSRQPQSARSCSRVGTLNAARRSPLAPPH